MDWEQLARPPADIVHRAEMIRRCFNQIWLLHGVQKGEAGILEAIDNMIERETAQQC